MGTDNTDIRPTAFAGQFYSADRDELCASLDHMLYAQSGPPPLNGAVPKVLIAPHAGHVYSGPVAASAYRLLQPARARIRKVVLMGPSHRVAFRGVATCTAQAWDSPLGPVPIDRAAIDSLAGLPMVGPMDKAHAQEHSLEVHVPFLQRVLDDFALIPLVAGETPRDVVAAILAQLWGGDETLVVISTDLSHYLDYHACQNTDAHTAQAIGNLDSTAIGGAQACGRVPLGGLLHLARARHLDIQTLDIRNSGDTAGPKDKVVGYGAWALYETTQSRLHALGGTLCQVARACIQSGLKSGKPAKITFNGPVPALLTDPGAVFVTLKHHGQLRGCIGSMTAYRPLIDDVVENAFKAAFADPRFAPLTQAELNGISLSVSVLTAPTVLPVTSQDDLLSKIRPHVDGLIIEDGGKRALFLPSVWDALPDPAQFLAHLKAKAGMAADHWSASFSAHIFQAIELKEG